ncbi:hypothetical protein GRI38_10730 [Altererythrobacter aurantiacus]|uniref:SGNH hydrolase-type esterase domain-containing protein n=1 Tax=Parapontixanthobacter aurantiacus TaxID=1463599 RepID=A0A844ZLE9_9SPHN|nr:SGNH/GDSL hydrolase family protein [Parapontixanthobacter aurantiacus]MXO86499.1 hypothetical protein [Parapontixanthobacter aurantiacus]
MQNSKAFIRFVLPSSIILVLLSELAVRAMVDIKLFERDTEVGYWFKPGQSGGSLLTGSYAFNSDGFGVADEFRTTNGTDVLLVGDSVVWGTSAHQQEERLGPQLQRVTGWKVWPLATGSWSLANELRYLKRVPLEGTDAIIFVLNSADVGQPSHWNSEYVLPRSRPPSYLLYSLQRLYPFLRPPEKELPVRPADLKSEWEEFAASVDVPVYVIGYESGASSGSSCSWLPVWLDVPTFCYDPIGRNLEGAMLDSIHLTAEGNKLFARFIDGAVHVP